MVGERKAQSFISFQPPRKSLIYLPTSSTEDRLCPSPVLQYSSNRSAAKRTAVSHFPIAPITMVGAPGRSTAALLARPPHLAKPWQPLAVWRGEVSRRPCGELLYPSLALRPADRCPPRQQSDGDSLRCAPPRVSPRLPASRRPGSCARCGEMRAP